MISLAERAQGFRSGRGLAVGEDDIVVQQAPLSVKADKLAPRAQPRIQSQNRLFAQRGCQQQLAQVFGKHTNGLGIGALARLDAHLRLHGQRQQALEAVGHSQPDLGGGGVLGLEEAAFQHRQALAFGAEDAQAEDLLILSTTHGQDAVGGRPGDRLLPLEVVAVLLRLPGLGIETSNKGGAEDTFACVEPTQLGAGTDVLADPFSDDVTGTGESVVDGGDFLVGADEGEGHRLRIAVVSLGEELSGEQLQTLLAGHGGARAPLRAEGQIHILQRLDGARRLDPGAQLIGQHALVIERLQDRVTTLLQFCQLGQSVANGGDGNLIEAACLFLAVAGDEGDRAPFIEQGNGGGNLLPGDAEIGGDPTDEAVSRAVRQSGIQHAGRRGLTLEAEQIPGAPPVDEGLVVDQITALWYVGID